MPKRFTNLRRAVCGLAAVGTIAVGAVAISASSASAATVTKTVVTSAEGPGSSPNYIFPMEGITKDSIYNIDGFQYLMYRPLYWLGKGTSPDLNPALSLANTPVYSNGNATVTITMKTYKWNDGEKVTATDVQFFLNMYDAVKTKFYGYFGTTGIPNTIKSIKVTSTTKLTITLTKGFNPHWFTYNELAQITPFPLAWTKTATTAAPGSGGCAKATFGTGTAACMAVFKYLSAQAGVTITHPTATSNALAGYATNPLWGVVDGPFKLSAFGPTADVTFVPNPTYSGPNKPTIKRFQEVPFTSTSAEFDALASGSVDVGYLPTTDITHNAKSMTKVGPNNPRLTSTYQLSEIDTWGIFYMVYNFKSTGQGGQDGAIINQLYFRQAMQYLVNQPLLITRLQHGYGVVGNGPVPILPKNPFVSKTEKKGFYNYNPSKAKQLLSSHGWKIVKTGTDTCQKPGTGAGECGKGIKKGAKLQFTIAYSDVALQKNQMAALKGSWGSVGINIKPIGESFNVVYSTDTKCTKGCPWSIGYWGGWTYSPDFYPTGELLFEGSAASNNGSFTTPKIDTLIKKTDFTNTKLTAYENALGKALPYVWMPGTETLVEVHKGLSNPTKDNCLKNITPAYWKWT